MNVFNLIIRRQEKLDVNVYVVSFEYDETHISNPEETLRAAIQEYLATPDGKNAREYACGDFNWGDVFALIPYEWFEERGLKPALHSSVEVEVNHDEVLDLGNYDGESTASSKTLTSSCDCCNNACKAMCFCEENMEDSDVCSKCSCWQSDECRMHNGGCEHFKNGLTVL